MTDILHDSDCSMHNEPAYPNGPCDCSALTAREEAPAEGAEEAVVWVARVMEVREEAALDGVGAWTACSGCQESVDGQVSSSDYPYSAAFGCQPGGGCSECGGLGVKWDTTDWDEAARFMLEHGDSDGPSPASADKLRWIIDAATDAALPQVCDVTGTGAKERAAIQVEIATHILAALNEGGV